MLSIRKMDMGTPANIKIRVKTGLVPNVLSSHMPPRTEARMITNVRQPTCPTNTNKTVLSTVVRLFFDCSIERNSNQLRSNQANCASELKQIQCSSIGDAKPGRKYSADQDYTYHQHSQGNCIRTWQRNRIPILVFIRHAIEIDVFQDIQVIV